MRYLPIVLLFGIILNFGCVVFFRLSLDRKHQREIREMASSFHEQIVSFSSDALRRIDDYFISNRVSNAVSPSGVSTVNPQDVLFKDSGEWDYSFMMIDGIPFARVGIVNFSVGSRFPRGGSITAIYPDYVIVNDSLSFRNRSFVSLSRSSPLSASDSVSVVDHVTKPSKELSNYVRTTNN